MAKWNKADTMWMLSLYGTAIGAGVLFLPINAGMGGLIPLIVMLVLAFPLTFLTHRALCHFVLGGSDKSDDITIVGENYFGKFGGVLLTLLYFFAIFPILLVYSVGITNNISSFFVNQLGLAEPNRLLLSFFAVGILMFVVSFGEEVVVKGAKEQNLPILSYLANHFKDMKTFALVAPVIAFVAMGKSFFGHYLGAREGLNRILFYATKQKISPSNANKTTALLTFLVAWCVAYKNPSVLEIIENIGGPILAIILYLMPLYAIYKFPQLHKYKNLWQNLFILCFGLITISTAIYKLF
ncbi:hypothetical protein NHP190003_05220 [Helicobacter sp. NHP19-003]|uniref:Serine transporter n=1 Tax=Helicobacter gastrocanis TaxID=2849641 RepID=A0ABM7SGN5_9HELI|nr:aromatic amino acid transport family protein [Helicobacter sp. NHP19-003]BCZ17240.1 hypothetical protein NHP190003_05220 [Helicobacter sp. NHP19-003]